MGASRSTGYTVCSFSCAVIDILLKLGLVNIDLSSLLLYLQMFDGQLTFDDTEIGSCAPLVTIGRVFLSWDALSKPPPALSDRQLSEYADRRFSVQCQVVTL